MHKIEIIGTKLKAGKTIEDVHQSILHRLNKVKVNNSTEKMLLENFVNYPQYDEGDDILISIVTEFEFNNYTYNMKLSRSTYKDELDIYTLELTGLLNISNEDFFQLKKQIAIVFQRSFNGFYWLYDSHNEKISSELYKEIHNIENNMRNLIIQFMLKSYGIEWFEDNILPEYRDKSFDFNQWYMKSKYQTFKKVKSELFNLQVSDLISMLKESFPNKLLNKVKSEINSILDKLEVNSNQVILNDITNVKNIWMTHSFDELLGVNFESEWTEFSKLRNTIAHNKLVCHELFDDIKSKGKELNDKIDGARVVIEERLKSNEDYGKRMLIREIDNDFLFNDTELKRYFDVEDVLDDLRDSEELIEFYDKLENLEREMRNNIEEIQGSIAEIISLDFAEVTEKESLIGAIIELLVYYKFEDTELYRTLNTKYNENVQTDLFDLFLKKLEEVEDLLEVQNGKFDISYISDFCESLNIVFPNNFNRSQISFKVEGGITPDFGNSDNLRVEAYEGNIKKAVGLIDIQYGDYERDEDTGMGTATIEQGIFFDFHELNDFFDEKLEQLERIHSINELFEELLQY